jgi:hypothetical protein
VILVVKVENEFESKKYVLPTDKNVIILYFDFF